MRRIRLSKSTPMSSWYEGWAREQVACRSKRAIISKYTHLADKFAPGTGREASWHLRFATFKGKRHVAELGKGTVRDGQSGDYPAFQRNLKVVASLLHGCTNCPQPFEFWNGAKNWPSSIRLYSALF